MHYFELKGMSFRQQLEFVKARKDEYFNFGAIGLFMEITPLLSFLFTFTNSIGAALWSIDLENDSSAQPLQVATTD